MISKSHYLREVVSKTSRIEILDGTQELKVLDEPEVSYE